MATAREIQKRIRSVKNIAQITRALEAVSASKVRRAQARVLASRAFAEKAWEILLNVQSMGGGAALHPLLTERAEINNVMIVLVTSNRGLAGAFNTNIIRVAQRFGERLGKPVQYVTVGRKGRDSLIRAQRNVVAEFIIPDNPSISDLTPVNRLAIDAFLSGEVDDVYIAYTDFINTLTQRPVVLGWLPLVPHQVEDQVAAEFVKDVPQVSSTGADYEYEPSPEAILDEIVPRFTELQLYQAVLESQASEHSARMVAMRNASDNATSLASDLTLVYNKARQAGITAEILDIVGGTEALQASIDKVTDDILAASFEMPRRPPAPRVAAAVGGAQAMAAAAAVLEADDLTRIEGIGRKMSSALMAAGISTFDQLAQADEAALRAAIEAAGMRFAPSMASWREQAAYAARGDWDGLAAYQATLTGGRKSSD